MALKVYPADEEHQKFFEQEVNALRSVDHRNVAKLLEIVPYGDFEVAVLEYVPGTTLADVAKLSLARVANLGYQLARGLCAIHQAGLIHADLKPANVQVTDTDAVCILDLGIAQPRERPPEVLVEDQAVPCMGTAGYMSPEQIDGKIVPSSDVWSLGCVLYELSEGKPAFQRETLAASLEATLHEELDFSTLDAKSGLLSSVVRQCLQRDSGERPQLDEVVEQLYRLLSATNLVSCGESPTGFVGRSRELQSLAESLLENRVVNIYGLPGIGKSKLANEFARRFEAQADRAESGAPRTLNIVELAGDETNEAHNRAGDDGCAPVLFVSRARQVNRECGFLALRGLGAESEEVLAWVESLFPEMSREEHVALAKDSGGHPGVLKELAQSGEECRHEHLVDCQRNVLSTVTSSLSVSDNKVVAMLTTFRGGLSVDAAAAVCATTIHDARGALERFADTGLIYRFSAERYRMEPWVRRNINVRSIMSIERAKARHLEYFLELVKSRNTARQETSKEHRSEVRNVRIAICQYGRLPDRSEKAMELARAAAGWFQWMAEFDFARETYVEATKALNSSVSDRWRSNLCYWASLFCSYTSSRCEEGESWLARAEEIRPDSDRHSMAYSNWLRVKFLLHRSRFVEALSLINNVEAVAPTEATRASLLLSKVVALLELGRFEEAYPVTMQVIATHRGLNKLVLALHGVNNLGVILVHTGQASRARRAFNLILRTSERKHYRDMKAFALGGLGRVDLSQEHYRSAKMNLHRALSIWTSLGNATYICDTKLLLAQASLEDDIEFAKKMLLQGIELARDLPQPASLADGLEHVSTMLPDHTMAHTLTQAAQGIRAKLGGAEAGPGDPKVADAVRLAVDWLG